MIGEKMTMENDGRGRRTKPKSSNEKIVIDTPATNVIRDEARSFLNFSRENLSICQSELEQGFNKPSRCFRLNRHSILSLVAIFVALVCAGIEIWKLHRVISNTRDIESLKRDVDALRHRLLGEDFMDELKAFEEQLYADSSEGDEDSGEADIDNADYDNNYEEDYSPSWNDYFSDSSEATKATTRSLLPKQSQSTLKKEESKNSRTSLNNASMDRLTVLGKIEDRRGEESSEKSREEARKNVTEEFDKRDLKNEEKHAKQRRAIPEETSLEFTRRPTFLDDYFLNNGNRSASGNPFKSNDPRTTKKKKKQKKKQNSDKLSTTEAVPSWDRNPPKKYFAVTRLDASDDFSISSRTSGRRSLSPNRKKTPGKIRQASELTKSLKSRVMTRRHLRGQRQILAAHYGADSSLFGTEDEHTGNGRAKHNEGIFKAWRSSEWVTDLGMNRYFTLSRDGKLSVHESGLYFVYGQIHYLDEHDENGFHILVNGQPILQCMVYSPGTGHKSRSCFSGQITILRAGDRLILKDVGPARYTLFQQDKSFFGLVKLGDLRQHQQQPKHTTQTPETRR